MSIMTRTMSWLWVEQKKAKMSFTWKFSILLKYFIIYAIIIVPISPPSPPSTQPSIGGSIVNPHTTAHVYGPFTCVLWQTPLPSFNQPHLPNPSNSCQCIPWFYASGALVLVHYFILSTYNWDSIVFVFYWLACFT